MTEEYEKEVLQKLLGLIPKDLESENSSIERCNKAWG